MARALWSGNISFGLVQIPVGVHSAEAHEDDLPMTLLDVRDHAPVGYKHVNKISGEEVPKELRVKGFEVAKNKFVVLTDADFRAANVKATETIEIQRFVDVGDIPSLRFERPYWLSPQRKGQKPYVLLREALEKTGKVAVATIVMRQRQNLCVVFPVGDVLAMQLLRYDNETVDAKDIGIPDQLEGVVVKPAEIEMATQLVQGMTGPFDTSEFHDTYQDDLRAIIDQRRAHPDSVPEVPKKKHAGTAEVTDLMSLLQRSVQERVKEPRSSSSSSSSSPAAARPRRTRAPTTRRTRTAG
ncbi:MAG: Ku protein [Deltaproteobacteria bacterium]|nr:Ku protein [Deltaproteobacteria bacterium]